MITLGTSKISLNENFKESIFSKGEHYSHCQSLAIIKNGKLNERWRYVCKECNKSFNDLTKSSLPYTKLPLAKWFK